MKKMISLSLVMTLIFSMCLTACSYEDLMNASSALAAAPEEGEKEQGKGLVFEDGKAQPILEYTNLRDAKYTNEGSDILRFCVYVETDHDTDGDGKADLVEALVQVPRAAAEGDFKAATIYDPTPYGAGTVEETSMDATTVHNPVPFDYKKLYEQGDKRVPKGSMTTLEAAEIAEPESWNYRVPVSGDIGYTYAQAYDYFLVRGFAVVEAGGIGTYGSEGFELCGFDLERDSHKCVVEWLAGNRRAYTDPYNDIEISADWSNGNVAMTGCSYGGTLPFEVATTGVEGLKTIIPFAGIASWYDYTNSQGAPIYLSAAYADSLAAFNSGSAYLDDDWTVINDDYASFLWQLSQDQAETNGNYDEIWAGLDYTLDPSKINCTALIVHGMNDFNVCTKQSDLMARAFEKAGKDYRLVLHQDGHNILNGIVVNGELWQSIMNKWLSHYLYDVDNNIEDMPKVSVQSNVDGSFKAYDSWNDYAYDSFEYDKTVNPDNVSHVDTTAIGKDFAKYHEATDDFDRPLLRDNYYLSMPESTKATYVFDLPDNYTIYGVPEVHLKLSTRDVGKDGMVISALLMDTIDEETNFKAYLTKERLHYTLPKHTLGVMETGGGLPRTKVIEFVKSNATAKLITFGHSDLANYGGGYEGKDYTKKTDEMKAGEYYDYTIYLQPTSYTFEPGHKAVLVVTGWDPYCDFLDEDLRFGVVEDSTESSYTYAFNIDNSAFEFRIPKSKTEPTEYSGASEKKDEDAKADESGKEVKEDKSDKDAKTDETVTDKKEDKSDKDAKTDEAVTDKKEDKADKDAKADEAVTDKKEDKADKDAKADEAVKDDKKDKSDKDAKADESDKDDKKDKSDKDAKTDKSDKDAKTDKSDKDAKTDKSDKDAKTDETAKADKDDDSKVSIPFRFARKEEGVKLLLANEAYYKEFTQNKLDYVMQKKNATMDEYKEFASEQVLDWTSEEKDLIIRGMKEIEETIKGKGWKLPNLDTIVFIRTTMAEENGVLGYTHGTQIYLRDPKEMIPEDELSDEFVSQHFMYILSHEIFHCLTRCNPDFRKQMYGIIGMTVEDKDFEIPPSVWEYFIANPDVEHHDSHAVFKIDGKDIDCFTATVTKKHFEKEGEKFMDEMVVALVPVDGTDKYYFKEDASNFDKLFGENTGYVIDPEECMADNFGYALIYGKKGPDGEGYKTPEIIDKIYEIFTK